MPKPEKTAVRDLRLMTLAIFLWGAGEGLFMYIQPLYIKQLGATPAQIGGVLSLWWLAAAVTYIPAGYISDRLPRKPVLLGSWVTGIIALLIFALARDWRHLIPAVILYGLSAYAIPVINVYVATAAKGRSLERVFTTTFAGYTAGTILSPAVGGALAEALSMRVVYLTAAGVIGLSATVLLFVSPQLPPARPGRREGPRLLLNRRFLTLVAPLMFSFFAIFLTFPLAPNFVADVRGMSTAQVGALGSVYAMGMTLLSVLLGRVNGRKRPWALVLGHGMVWLATGLLLWAPGLVGVALAFLLRGAGQACRPLTKAYTGDLLGQSHQGLALGATDTAIAVAQVLATAAAGWLYANGPTWPFVTALFLLPLATVFTLRLPGSDRT